MTPAGESTGESLVPYAVSSSSEEDILELLPGSLVPYAVSSEDETVEMSLVPYAVSSSSEDEAVEMLPSLVDERNPDKNLISCGACCTRNTTCPTNCRYSLLFPNSSFAWMFCVIDKLNMAEAYFSDNFFSFPPEIQVKRWETDFPSFYQMISDQNETTAELEDLRCMPNVNPLVRDEMGEDFGVYLEDYVNKMSFGMTSEEDRLFMRLKILQETQQKLHDQVHELALLRDHPFFGESVFSSLVEFLINKPPAAFEEELASRRVEALNHMQTQQIDQLYLVTFLLHSCILDDMTSSVAVELSPGVPVVDVVSSVAVELSPGVPAVDVVSSVAVELSPGVPAVDVVHENFSPNLGNIRCLLLDLAKKLQSVSNVQTALPLTAVPVEQDLQESCMEVSGTEFLLRVETSYKNKDLKILRITCFDENKDLQHVISVQVVSSPPIPAV